MFTGIVSDVGTVAALNDRDKLRRIAIECASAADAITIGASIAVAGVCLTVVARRPLAGNPARCVFEVEAAAETLAVTTAGDWQPGTRLNLERSLKAGDELGGHFVAGHVDGVAVVAARDDLGEQIRFTFDAPPPLARFIASKGSVTLDGTSLTVNGVAGSRFDCLLIPHTLAVTTWGQRAVGDRVNLEVDVIARYLARLMEDR
jgi:riboflavin synthase